MDYTYRIMNQPFVLGRPDIYSATQNSSNFLSKIGIFALGIFAGIVMYDQYNKYQKGKVPGNRFVQKVKEQTIAERQLFELKNIKKTIEKIRRDTLETSYLLKQLSMHDAIKKLTHDVNALKDQVARIKNMQLKSPPQTSLQSFDLFDGNQNLDLNNEIVRKSFYSCGDYFPALLNTNNQLKPHM